VQIDVLSVIKFMFNKSQSDQMAHSLERFKFYINLKRRAQVESSSRTSVEA
jgi:uncharacterized membrane protein